MSGMPTVRRARAALGTLVEITIHDCGERVALIAGEQAFGAIDRVHRAMSFHAHDSDLARLNAAVAGTVLRVDPQLVEVLQLAHDIACISAGVFDVTVAPRLVETGVLPRPSAGAPPPSRVRDAFDIVDACTIVKREPAWIDLGGIAKGYAVDRAIEALRAHGVNGALVNAGGDMRAIGPRSVLVHVRHPDQPGRTLPLVELRDMALATSARYFSAKPYGGGRVNALLDARTGACDASGASVSVLAPECAIADALTKVVLATGDTEHPALAAHAACAVLLAPPCASSCASSKGYDHATSLSA